MTKLAVAWFSAGVSSFVATGLALEKYPDAEVLYIDIEDHHPDSARFVKDFEDRFGKQVKVLMSRYKCVHNVLKSQRFINSPYGSKCTQFLKKRVRQEWELENRADIYVWGMDYSKNEIKRSERIRETMRDYTHVFPLIDNKITKQQAHGILKDWGVKRPAMYDLGYPNNNCVGCVKGGMGYWNKIKIDFPDVFNRMALLEREINKTCIKGVFLDELEPGRGRDLKIIVPDCGEFCEQAEKP